MNDEERDDDKTPPDGIRVAKLSRRTTNIRLALASAVVRLHQATVHLDALAECIEQSNGAFENEWLMRLESKIRQVADDMHQAAREVAEARRRGE